MFDVTKIITLRVMTNEFSCDVELGRFADGFSWFCKPLVMKQNEGFLRLVIPRI